MRAEECHCCVILSPYLSCHTWQLHFLCCSWCNFAANHGHKKCLLSYCLVHAQLMTWTRW